MFLSRRADLNPLIGCERIVLHIESVQILEQTRYDLNKHYDHTIP